MDGTTTASKRGKWGCVLIGVEKLNSTEAQRGLRNLSVPRQWHAVYHRDLFLNRTVYRDSDDFSSTKAHERRTQHSCRPGFETSPLYTDVRTHDGSDAVQYSTVLYSHLSD